MVDVAPHSQPRLVPNRTLAPPSSLAIPPSARSPNGRVTLDAFSPVTKHGSYEFDRIIKAGEVHKRTRKTKSWKPIYIVLRPNLLSIYKNAEESRLRHQINLSELTAVARQKDSKRKDKHVFGLFSPSRNYHLEARSEKEAQAWVELIRREAKMDDDEEEMVLASPGGANTPYKGFTNLDASIRPSADERAAGYSSSDAEAFGSSQPLPKQRNRGSMNIGARRTSHVDYSGPDHGSISDFSDSAGPAARMSALSLVHTEGRPSTGSAHIPNVNSIYGPSSTRPSMGTRNASQLSGIGQSFEENRKAPGTANEERVIYHGWIYLLKSTSGVRQWKKVWMTLRPKQLALYKTNEEYTAQLVLPFPSIIDVVEIDPISKSKTACMQVISEERNYRFCAVDEESLAKWLGAFKSLLSKRKAKVAGTT